MTAPEEHVGALTLAEVTRVEEYGVYLRSELGEILVLIIDVAYERVPALRARYVPGDRIYVRILKYVAGYGRYRGTIKGVRRPNMNQPGALQRLSGMTEQLDWLLAADDFGPRSAELVDHWDSTGVGFEAVEPIFQFMEEHPSVEMGTPGALVHFVERFHTRGYEKKLLESISRRPTEHTVWMLNRLINGTKEPMTKQIFIEAMARARSHPSAEAGTVNQIDHFLQNQQRS